jgi:cobalt transporter subunit CbtA
MLARVLSVGLLAGLLAGLLIAVLQQVTTTPLILLAETYETQGAGASAVPPAPGAAKEHDHATHDHGWKPADGLPRFFYTSVATVATAVGMSFLLLAGMIFAGDPIDERRALAWAIAGFVATGLAPAAGLAP